MKQLIVFVFIIVGIFIFQPIINAQSSATWEKLYMNGAIFRGVQTEDGGYVGTGLTRIQNEYKIAIIRTDVFGDTLWNRIIGATSHTYTANWIEESNDKGFIIAGFDGSRPGGDAYLLKVDSLGVFQWSKSFGGNDLDEAMRVLKTTDGGYLVGCRTFSFGNGFQHSCY